MARLLAATAVAAAASAAALEQPVWPYNTRWDAPSPGPGTTTDGYATYADAMPLGNGALTALAWANASAGGVGIYVGHQHAQSSWSELFKLALLQVTLSPNPWAAGAYFNQTLDLETASVSVLLGGSSLADYVVSLRVWADANADVLRVDVAARDPAATFDLRVVATSTRPAGVYNYTPAFGTCGPISTQPDVYLSSVPAPVPALAVAAAAAAAVPRGVRHASRQHWLPSTALPRAGVPLPRQSAFQPGSLLAYHRNADSDGLYVASTLEQQGLPQLINSTQDWWRDLTAGFALDAGDGPALARVDAHTLASSAPAAAFQLRVTVLAVQTDTPDEWVAQLGLLVGAATDRSGADPWGAHAAWWAGFWGRSYVSVNASCGGACDGFTLSRKYALTRYVQAVQSRGTWIPIKFNGQNFIAAMGSRGEPDFRQWGFGNWWQNTRLPYGAMAYAGDFDSWRVILDYYTVLASFLSQRTPAYWNHSGIWTTETHTLFGAYLPSDYGCSRPAGYPVALETSGYLHLDGGGDSGTGEWAMMAMDYYTWTGDAQFLPLAFGAADFLSQHYANRSATTGRQVVWPAQVLETYWCEYDTATSTYVNCCEDDSPTVSAMHALGERLLALPPSVTTPAQRAAWGAWAAILPELPVAADGSTVLPARVVSSPSHNNEGPELYFIHPHRMQTKGRAVASGLDISLGASTLRNSRFAGENEGWNYGINAAALIGDAPTASAQLLARARTGPAKGYRFDAFAEHYQDYEPSADHYANMNRALQESLLQTGDDAGGTLVLLPAWPCSWDVDFRLVGPANTTVTVSYAGGRLVSLDVQPPSRAGAVKWAACVTAGEGA